MLEVGGSIAGLQIELLKRGAAHVTNIEVPAAYLTAAQTLAGQLGLANRINYHYGDFARDADAAPAADIVILHRVVCCYPDMPRLVTAAAQHARLMALSFPTGAWYMRAGEKVMNFVMWLTRSGFRFYVHPPAAIISTAVAAGLRPVQQKSSWPWQIVVFERGR